MLHGVGKRAAVGSNDGHAQHQRFKDDHAATLWKLRACWCDYDSNASQDRRQPSVGNPSQHEDSASKVALFYSPSQQFEILSVTHIDQANLGVTGLHEIQKCLQEVDHALVELNAADVREHDSEALGKFL